MNIEILKKLIALANNNPNNHEANSAARRVCKMLGEAMDSGKLNFKSKPKVASHDPRYTYAPPKSTDPFNMADIIEMMRKVREEQAKERANQYRDGSWEGFNKDPHEYTKTYDYESYYKNAPNTYRSWVDDNWAGNPKRKSERRELKCTVCHKIVSTVFVGHAERYRCGDCFSKK